jgi:hypothetical protein
MNELQSQLTLALIVPYLLQWLKGQSWFPLVSFTSGKLNAIVAAIIATAAGFGIAFNYNPDVGALTITGLTAAGLWQGLLHAVQQFFMQHAAYKTLIAPSLPGAEQAAWRDAAGYVPDKKVI